MEDFIGTYGNRLIVAVVGVGVALLLLAIAMWIIRRRSGSAPFIRGGRNRQPRLQVLDATAVDARRRLVLVRRDNVEHLVMIGGPTDIVIESGIGAIPIVKEVRDPDDVPMKTLPRQDQEMKVQEGVLPQERREALQQQSPVQAVAATSIQPTEEPARRPLRAEPAAPVARAPVAAAPQPRPAPASRDIPPAPRPAPPVGRDTPRPAPQAAPAPASVVAPTPVSSSVAPVPAPAIARHVPEVAAPVRPPVAVQAAPVLPLAAAVVDTPAQGAEPKRMEAPVVSVATQPVATVEAEASHPAALFTAREAIIDQSSAADFLDAARERVLPTLTPPSPSAEKPDAAVILASDAEPKFSDDLASDFESFLEAEIAKGQDAAAIAPADATPDRNVSEKDAIVEPPITGATPDKDMQKEMARIFGEISVTRDR
ncbi:flagellar biosynthetic protein FliO [Agrobacterium tumefaciens]|uniref:flagellar biosynthetic protein FliO n=1 Tax=Agrobacterium tumefaciens TaxID=358 RepID=UPI00287D4558|nr:flagellar biosynthetic protein FliO [Agrobacterium tumefaciens]MDS7596889.1 flagellar biosynthetic protein FliO [Agrobacterium tumefaciens]